MLMWLAERLGGGSWGALGPWQSDAVVAHMELETPG